MFSFGFGVWNSQYKKFSLAKKVFSYRKFWRVKWSRESLLLVPGHQRDICGDTEKQESAERDLCRIKENNYKSTDKKDN